MTKVLQIKVSDDMHLDIKKSGEKLGLDSSAFMRLLYIVYKNPNGIDVEDKEVFEQLETALHNYTTKIKRGN